MKNVHCCYKKHRPTLWAHYLPAPMGGGGQKRGNEVKVQEEGLKMKPQEEFLNQSSKKPGVITFPGNYLKEGWLLTGWVGGLGSRKDNFKGEVIPSSLSSVFGICHLIAPQRAQIRTERFSCEKLVLGER